MLTMSSNGSKNGSDDDGDTNFPNVMSSNNDINCANGGCADADLRSKSSNNGNGGGTSVLMSSKDSNNGSSGVTGVVAVKIMYS